MNPKGEGVRAPATRAYRCLLLFTAAVLAGSLRPAVVVAMEPQPIGRLGFAAVMSFAYSPTNDLLAVSASAVSGLHEVRILDATTGTPVFMIPGAYRKPAFSWDGKTVATGGVFDGAQTYITLWDTELGRETARLTGDAHALAFSPDGSILASSFRGITLWNVATRQEIAVLVDNNDASWLAFSPDGRILASGDETVKLWDIEARQEISTLPRSATALAFSPDGRTLAIGSGVDPISLWDVAALREVATLTGHTGAVLSVAFSPDGGTLVSGSADQTIKLWDIASTREMATLAGHEGPVAMVAFNRDGTDLISGRWDDDGRDRPDDIVRRWDVASRQQIDSFGGRTSNVWSLAFSPDGDVLASGSLDHRVTLWDVVSWRGFAVFDTERNPAFSPDGTILATAGSDGIVLRDVASWRPTAALAGNPGFLAFSPDGAILSSTTTDGVTLWSVATSQRIATLSASLGGNRWAVFSPNGTLLAASGDEDTVLVWELAPVLELAAAVGTDVPLRIEPDRLIGHTQSIEELAFSPDGQTLASGSRDGTTRFWDVASRQEVAVLDTGGRARGIAFSPDGRTLATVGRGENLKFWDVASRREIGTFSSGHRFFAYAMAFSPDGSLLATGGDGSVALWGVPDFGEDPPTAVEPRGKARSTWSQMKRAALIPRETAFLPNYPNPFNPETWIPFDLHDHATVTISIYDASGRIVRRLELGERPAGTYRTRDRAAHWDGRNEQGELVSSGVYVAELRAGDYRSTRRITVRK
jgi:WD40 repeat protein